MPEFARKRSVGAGLALALAALAPAEPEQSARVDPPSSQTPASLARVRSEQGIRTYDLAWLYYSENRIDADKVYRWSRRAWEADRDAATDQAGEVRAAEAHLGRMLKLEAKIAKIRQLGFGNSLDVAEVEYYRKEAEYWRANAQAGGADPAGK